VTKVEAIELARVEHMPCLHPSPDGDHLNYSSVIICQCRSGKGDSQILAYMLTSSHDGYLDSNSNLQQGSQP
jgi:hypothetical protein